MNNNEATRHSSLKAAHRVFPPVVIFTMLQPCAKAVSDRAAGHKKGPQKRKAAEAKQKLNNESAAILYVL
ncbi:hypothetical protein CEXT_313091 [Caerostris extrusa]|uniref:Uncharacterized protein n=1 Tax=Caerostris extrusa TaxID=172846 RepID=A0AAV4MAM4_CAEEX|nr:hypothetical protein CEXT_313091 [Caerostris extrusa]